MRRSILIAVGLMVSGCATNPVTGKREFSLVSEAQEIEMGRQSLAASEAQSGFYNDPELEQYIRDMGMAMARASERPNLPWEFHVLDDRMINAFAAPGGFIFVTRGILAVLNSGAELAGVLGHEIGHVTAKHSVVQMSNATLAQVGLVAGAIAAPDMAASGVGQLAQAGASLLFLKFGRDDESQSDELGHRYSLQQGYDVREMPKTFRTLQRVGESAGEGSRIPAFMSTHPDPGNRVEATQRMADTVSDYSKLTTDREHFLRLLDGLVYGEDPRQGYFEQNRFLHPVLKFQFDKPANWQSVNYAVQLIMAEPNGQAQLTLGSASESTAAAAAQAFTGQQGISVRSSGAITVNGIRGQAVAFTANTSQGQQLAGQVFYLEYGGQVYEILGLALAQAWQQQGGAIDRAMRSFAPTAASQSFRRVRELHLVTLSANTTPAVLAQQSNGAGTAAEIALINGAQENDTLPRGRMVKTIRWR
ncbi:MAG TPA: M48 family metalloprotease [Gemmatimonadales bacterium]|nr:M48 family metalloprotease [Gemmatimonadales bacterium]